MKLKKKTIMTILLIVAIALLWIPWLPISHFASMLIASIFAGSAGIINYVGK